MPLDPQATASVIQLAANVSTALRNARDLVSATNNRELREQILIATDDLISLRERLLDVLEENRTLRLKLQEKERVEGPFPPFGYFYLDGDNEHSNPICPKCYQGQESKIALLTALDATENGRRHCRMCDYFIYESEQTKRSYPTPPPRNYWDT